MYGTFNIKLAYMLFVLTSQRLTRLFDKLLCTPLKKYTYFFIYAKDPCSFRYFDNQNASTHYIITLSPLGFVIQSICEVPKGSHSDYFGRILGLFENK